MSRVVVSKIVVLAGLGVAKPCTGAPVQTPLTINYETGTFGYLKWGVYPADGNVANGDQATRVVYHDDIYAAVTPEPASGLCILIGVAALRGRRRNLL